MKRTFGISFFILLGLSFNIAGSVAQARKVPDTSMWSLSSDVQISRKPAKSMEASLVSVSFKNEMIPVSEFRETYKHLSDAAFAEKLQGAQATDLMFFRSFVNTFYQDMSRNVVSPNLVLCLGDAHIENFGFMSFAGKTHYVFNDLDDSGVCPIEFDILRYFASVELAFPNASLLEKMALEYSEVLMGRKKAIHLEKSLIPNLQKKRDKILRKYIQAKIFKGSSDYSQMADSDKKTLLAEIKELPVFSGVGLLDAVEIHRATGGSAGLRRYWLLVQKDKEQDILELKEVARAGAAYGAWEQPAWSDSERMVRVKKYIWGQSPDFYDVVSVRNRPFLVRSRVKSSLDLDELSKKELEAMLRVQAGLLAEHHRQFAKEGIPGVEKWITMTTPLVVERYRKSMQQLKP
ncbi:DUF2252 domain-containing protein [Bdellovibrio bacteriovorus]|uniref:DUF2252 domain-containing protein n=1 Tax=Bdellovibrio bacteriovorus TaxID=959 RepID=UPI0021D3AAA6|nr:DUF2252 domain-containing protein [Bdellovibrio bacteriovorus]UXR63385.1 DUF2252 domain-containing protein [Bdellovibrio bacteriovorus]